MNGLDALISREENPNECSLCHGKKTRFIQENGKLKSVPCECTKDENGFRNHLETKQLSPRKLKKYIPNEIYHEEFDKEILKRDVEISAEWQVHFNAYVKTLEGIHNSIRLRKKPIRSYIVVAPPNFGKKHFAYSCIKTALEVDLKPTELLFIKDIGLKIKEKEYYDLKEMILEKDIIFISLGKYITKDDMYTLEYMMELAEIYATPIIVISKFPISYLCLFEPTLISEIGLKKTKKGYYGLLQLAGFNNDLMKADYISKSQKINPNSVYKQRQAQVAEETNETVDLLDSFVGSKEEDVLDETVEFTDFEKYAEMKKSLKTNNNEKDE